LVLNIALDLIELHFNLPNLITLALHLLHLLHHHFNFTLLLLIFFWLFIIEHLNYLIDLSLEVFPDI